MHKTDTNGARPTENRPSQHAIDRWERVEPGCTRKEAAAAIQEILRNGRVVGKRGWVRKVAPGMGASGRVGVVWHAKPDVCVVLDVHSHVAVTVLPRHGWRPDDPNHPERIGLTLLSSPSRLAGGRSCAATTPASKQESE